MYTLLKKKAKSPMATRNIIKHPLRRLLRVLITFLIIYTHVNITKTPVKNNRLKAKAVKYAFLLKDKKLQPISTYL